MQKIFSIESLESAAERGSYHRSAGSLNGMGANQAISK